MIDDARNAYVKKFSAKARNPQGSTQLQTEHARHRTDAGRCQIGGELRRDIVQNTVNNLTSLGTGCRDKGLPQTTDGNRLSNVLPYGCQRPRECY